LFDFSEENCCVKRLSYKISQLYQLMGKLLVPALDRFCFEPQKKQKVTKGKHIACGDQALVFFCAFSGSCI
jgi:hypothetical protein